GQAHQDKALSRRAFSGPGRAGFATMATPRRAVLARPIPPTWMLSPMSRLLCLLVLLSALLPTASGLAAPVADDQVTADRQDRFFGAVQAIYNPQRADEAGV